MTAAVAHTSPNAQRPRRGWCQFAVAFSLSTVWFALLAMNRWSNGLATGYDLGIFAQSAQSWSHGRLPHSDIRQIDLLGDHFSPIMAVVAMGWRFWPDPRVLLVAQAFSLGLTVALIAAYAYRSLGSRYALIVATMLLCLGPGVLGAALFDVHEVAFGAPVLALLAISILERRFRVSMISAVMLALVKEDLGLTIFGAGCAWWILYRERGVDDRRRAAMLGLTGIAAVAVAYVVIKSVNGHSEYSKYFGGHHTPAPLWSRVAPIALFVVASAFVGLRSPIVLMALPTLAWRVLSSNPSYWRIDFHYDLLPTVVAVIAAVDGIRRTAAASSTTTWRPRVIACVAVAAVVSTSLGTLHIVERTGHVGTTLSAGADLRRLEELSREIPMGRSVAASNDAAAYLVSTHPTYKLAANTGVNTDYVLFTTDGPWIDQFPKCAQSQLRGIAISRGWPVTVAGKYVLVATPEPGVVAGLDCLG